MTPDRLEQIRERVSKATPGPWHGDHDEYGCVVFGNYGWVCPGNGPAYDEDSEQGKADAEFVGHARTDVPDLLAEVERLTAALAQSMALTESAQTMTAQAISRLNEQTATVEQLTAELNAVADSEQGSYGDCRPDCDCSGHYGRSSCGCHVTGAEAREWIGDLEAEVERLTAELARVGICGDRIAGLLNDQPPSVCDLPAGHDGWHSAPNPPGPGGTPSRVSWTEGAQP